MGKKDLKAALGNGSKPDTTHVRHPTKVYIARASEYGNDKYERANYLRPTGSRREDFERLRGYLRAGIDHFTKVLDSMEYHQSEDPDLLDWGGMQVAAYAVDTDVTPGASVGASLLPHMAPGVASINRAITPAVRCGLLPEDPGQTWKNDKKGQ